MGARAPRESTIVSSSASVDARRHRTSTSQATGIGLLLLAFAVFAIATAWMYLTITHASRFQQNVRVARAARSLLFRRQLDAETGMRGFTSTGDRTFLEPYFNGTSGFASTADQLDRDLAALDLNALRGEVADQRRVFSIWVRTVAQPLIADRLGPATNRIQRSGKTLVDRFRRDDESVRTGLDIASIDADRAVTAALQRIIELSFAVALAVGGMYVYFLRVQAKLTAEALETRELYEAEKRIADSLQEALLQKTLPDVANLRFSAIYLPASMEANVGGDWYDAFELPDGRILFSIGDVAGHGVHAAITMSRARQAIISAALHEDDPAAVLARANTTLLLQDATMVTAICGYIDPRNREIVYATAGHPAPILVAEAAVYLPSDGIPLGLFADVSYRAFVAHAPDRGMLVLYTDGALEFDRDLIRGEERLLVSALAANRAPGLSAAEAMREHVFGTAVSTDDVAIMTIAFLGGTAVDERENSTRARIRGAQTWLEDVGSSPPERSTTRFSPLRNA